MSSNIVYTSIEQLKLSCKTLTDRINAIGLVLDNMETLMAEGDGAKQYELDTSQTRLQKTYSSFGELSIAYDRLLATQNKLILRANYNNNGRITRLVDSKNFIGRR